MFKHQFYCYNGAQVQVYRNKIFREQWITKPVSLQERPPAKFIHK